TDPRNDRVDALAIGRNAVNAQDRVAAEQAGLLSRAARDHRLDDWSAVDGTHLRADAHDRPAQRCVLVSEVLGCEEAGVIGIAHRAQQATDRAVDQGRGAERLRVHVIVLEDLPGLLVNGELGWERTRGLRQAGRAAEAGSRPGRRSDRPAGAESDRDRQDEGEDAADGRLSIPWRTGHLPARRRLPAWGYLARLGGLPAQLGRRGRLSL